MVLFYFVFNEFKIALCPSMDSDTTCFFRKKMWAFFAVTIACLEKSSTKDEKIDFKSKKKFHTLLFSLIYKEQTLLRKLPYIKLPFFHFTEP